MQDYHHPQFYPQVPTYLLYLCMMGSGSIYRVNDGIIMYVSASSSKLPCGCAGTDVYRLVDEQGNKVMDKLNHEEHKAYEGLALEHISLQGKDTDDFWEKVYQKNPSLRPIKISNLI